MDLVMLATSARGDTRLLHTTARRRAEDEGSGLPRCDAPSETR